MIKRIFVILKDLALAAISIYIAFWLAQRSYLFTPIWFLGLAAHLVRNAIIAIFSKHVPNSLILYTFWLIYFLAKCKIHDLKSWWRWRSINTAINSYTVELSTKRARLNAQIHKLRSMQQSLNKKIRLS